MKHLQAALTQLYAKWSNNPDQALSIATQLTTLFSSIGSREEPLVIVLYNYNFPHGIGDYKNFIDYYTWTKTIFEGCSNVRIKAIGLVSNERSTQARVILPDHLQQEIYWQDINADWDLAKGFDADINIFTGFSGKLSQEIVDQIKSSIVRNEKLKTLLDKATFLLNIATPLASSHNLILDFIPDSCTIHSRLEYETSIALDSDKPTTTRNFTEDKMGISPEAVGIKFDEALYEMEQTEKKPHLLLTLENKLLQKNLLELKEDEVLTESRVEQYVSDTAIGIGYLQNDEGLKTFINMALAIYNARYTKIDLIIPTKYFDASKFKMLFDKYGVGTVEVINADGKIHSSEVNKYRKLRLRVFEFSGISDRDKRALTVVSDLTAGSGDNSFSDVKGFPFFYMPAFKQGFMRSFIKYIEKQKDICWNDMLERYLDSLLKFRIGGTMNMLFSSSDSVDAFDFAALNYRKIKEAFMQVKNRIYQQHNAKHAFYQLINTFVRAQIRDHRPEEAHFVEDIKFPTVEESEIVEVKVVDSAVLSALPFDQDELDRLLRDDPCSIM